MKTGTRSLAICCMLLYFVVGFIAGVCPAIPGQSTQHHHHHKPVTHAMACAWACHASANLGAVDTSSPLALVWLAIILLPLMAYLIGLTWLIFFSARPPPSLFTI